MHTEGRENELLIALASERERCREIQKERDEARHGLDEWCKAAMQERARVNAAESALAAARREIAELRDDLGASHSRGAHLHCSKDRCDVAADGMALAAPTAAHPAAASAAEPSEHVAPADLRETLREAARRVSDPDLQRRLLALDAALADGGEG